MQVDMLIICIQNTDGGWPCADRTDLRRPQCRPQIPETWELILVEHRSRRDENRTCYNQRKTSESDQSGMSQRRAFNREATMWNGQYDVIVDHVKGWAKANEQHCRQLTIIDCLDDVVVYD